MDIVKVKKQTGKFINKYKYVCIVIILGLIFLTTPFGQKNDKGKSETDSNLAQEESVELQLSQILSKVNGAGKVEVFLAILSDEEVVYQEDYNNGKDNTNGDTVIITDADRNQSGLIQKRLSPVYRGAVVVCEGADSAEVHLAVVEAVMHATGLRSDQISVLKMK